MRIHVSHGRRQRNWDAVVVGILLAAVTAIFAEAQPAAAGPSFSAASIRVNRSGNNGRQSMTAGRLTFTSVSLKECIMAAYELRDYQVAGPVSLSSDRYDITGAAEGPASNAELRAMLKTLLANRFQLKVHRETRELPAYR